MIRLLPLVCLLGALTIVLGAFGAHALQESLSPEQLDSFNTGVRYQMYHVIVMLVILMTSFFNQREQNAIVRLFLVGIFFFSGSIYAISFGIDPKNIWFITPLGGLFFIVGWLFLAYFSHKKLKSV